MLEIQVGSSEELAVILSELYIFEVVKPNNIQAPLDQTYSRKLSLSITTSPAAGVYEDRPVIVGTLLDPSLGVLVELLATTPIKCIAFDNPRSAAVIVTAPMLPLTLVTRVLEYGPNVRILFVILAILENFTYPKAAAPVVSLRIKYVSAVGVAVQVGNPLINAFAAALAVVAPVPPCSIATVPVTFAAVPVIEIPQEPDAPAPVRVGAYKLKFLSSNIVAHSCHPVSVLFTTSQPERYLIPCAAFLLRLALCEI